jgi:hypothetical protein
MDSLMPTLIIVAVLAVIAFLLWRARPTAESLRLKRAARAGVSDEVFSDFEQHAVQIAQGVLSAARERLEAAAKQAGLPLTGNITTGGDGPEPLATGARMRGAARELVEAIREVRRLRDQDFASQQFAQAEERWAYLATAYADRYPLLADFIERMDDTGLDRVGSAPAVEAARLLRSELDSRMATYREIVDTLTTEPNAVWSLLCVVVLTMSLDKRNEKEEAALAARANPRTTDSWVALMNAQLKAALSIVHSVPPSERVSHRGVLALPLEDRDLGAALVQYCANEATAQGELDQARVLVMGDSTMLWLAHDVVQVRPYPEEAVPAYAKLAPLARAALRAEADQAEAALRALAEAADEQLDQAGKARVLDMVEQLRAGRSPEQVRGGTGGYESNPR